MRRRPRSGSKKWWALGVAVIVVAGAGAATWIATRSSAATVAPTLVAATSGPIRQTVTAAGTIAPARQANLSFTVAGTVTGVPVKVGQKVAKGAVLATVDSASLTASVESAQAAVDAASQQLSTVESDGSSSVQVAAATAQLAAARSTLAAAQQSLADATLVSPFAGLVAQVNIAVGDRVTGAAVGGSSAGSSGGNSGGNSGSGGSGSAAAATTSASAEIVVIGTDGWIVNAAVSGADLVQVKAGLQAEITPTDATTKVFGTVSTVGIVAMSGTSGSATFPVVVAVTGNPSGLFAGATVTVAIIVRQIPDVLTVPTFALHTVGGATVVYQMKGGHQVSTPVTIGAVYGPTTQILSGLKAGDQVVVPSFRGGNGPGTRTGTRTGQNGGGGFGGGGFGGGGFGGGGPGSNG